MSDFFFTFLDRSLAYDCPSCGQLCCKRSGLALDAQGDLLKFAAHEPRLAVLARPVAPARWDIVEANDGCAMLEPSGFCHLEVTRGRAEKPLTCRLFPFNAIARIGAVRVVDFHNVICPLQDVADARTGQPWAALAAEIEAEGDAALVNAKSQLPPDAEKLRWRGVEERVRDAIAGHLAEADFATFAAWQEEVAAAQLADRALPEPHSPSLAPRVEALRQMVAGYRQLFGVQGDAQLAAASRAAARQVALLSCSFRMNLLQRHGVPPYAVELSRMPRHLLATAQLVELGLLARQRPPGLRAATETFQGAAPVAALLGMWDRPARLHGEIPIQDAPAELRTALGAASKALRKGGRSLGEALLEGLRDHPVHLRGLALSQLAYGGAPLEIA